MIENAPEQPTPPPTAPEGKVIGRIEITVFENGSLRVGGEIPDTIWLGDTLTRALRFVDRELLAGRVVQQLTQGVQVAQAIPKIPPAPTRRWPIQ